jgi:hypothetical protein
MGPAPVPRKQPIGSRRAKPVRFPNPAITPRLINSDDFDKAGRSRAQRLLTVPGLRPGFRNFIDGLKPATWYADYSSQSSQVDARMSTLCTNLENSGVTI